MTRTGSARALPLDLLDDLDAVRDALRNAVPGALKLHIRYGQ